MTIDEILSAVQELRAQILDGCTEHPATALGLDRRCGTLHVNEEYIAVPRSGNRSLLYYGGFEYIPEEYITRVGDLTLYSIEHDRVLNALVYLEGQS